MTSLAHYLFDRLSALGVDCTFGVPGDFVLPLYAAQQQYGMRTVVCTHEPSAGFAADAYARLKGLGVALTTFGAGGLNMVNPVAMAYAEYSPVLVVSGVPEAALRVKDLHLHHMVKDFESQRRVFDEVTIASAVLDNPATAPAEIDRVLAAMRRHKRPGYLEFPRDMVSAEISPQAAEGSPHPAEAPGGEAPPEALEEALREIRGLLDRAERPVLYAGVGVRRNALMDASVKLAEAWGLPVVSSVLGKASFPESHPQYLGLFFGAVGTSPAREAMERADIILSLGVIHSDVNTGFYTMPLPTARTIAIGEEETSVFHHRYPELPMARVVAALAEMESPRKRAFVPPEAPPPADADLDPAAPLTTDGVIAALREIDQASHSFLSDIGDAWFIGLELTADVFMAAGYYASMGFAVPGALGAAIAEPNRRPFAIVGDGAFQMTGNELSTLVRQNLPATVLVLNNANYKMLEALDQPREYYKLPSWDYVALAHAQGAEGERAGTLEELRAALGRAAKATVPYLIEAILDPHDHAPLMRNIREIYAARKAAPPGEG